MELKKSPKADLEAKKGIFFELGLTLALAMLLFAFEWKADTGEVDGFDMVAEEQMEEEIIPITQQLTAPPPPPPPAPILTDLLEIVEDDTDIDDELEILDAEDESENVEPDMSNFGDFGDEDTGEEDIFTVVENPPVFPHGNVTAWVLKRVKYPILAQENGIEGRVYIKFVIERDGSVTNVEIMRGVDQSLDREAIRVINSMPKWKPGRQRDKAVRCSFQMPINFKLQ